MSRTISLLYVVVLKDNTITFTKKLKYLSDIPFVPDCIYDTITNQKIDPANIKKIYNVTDIMGLKFYDLLEKTSLEELKTNKEFVEKVLKKCNKLYNDNDIEK